MRGSSAWVSGIRGTGSPPVLTRVGTGALAPIPVAAADAVPVWAYGVSRPPGPVRPHPRSSCPRRSPPPAARGRVDRRAGRGRLPPATQLEPAAPEVAAPKGGTPHLLRRPQATGVGCGRRWACWSQPSWAPSWSSRAPRRGPPAGHRWAASLKGSRARKPRHDGSWHYDFVFRGADYPSQSWRASWASQAA